MTRRRGLVVAAALLSLAPAAARADEFESCRLAALDAQRLHGEQLLLEEREKLLVCVQPACPDVIQTSCRQWLAVNDVARPSVVVVAKDAGGQDLVDAQYGVDGAPPTRNVDGKPVELNPGTHKLRAVAPGRLPVDVEILVASGVKLRSVALVWPAPPEARPSAPAPSPAPASRPIPTRVWVLGGASAVALGTATVFGILAWRKYDDLQAAHLGDRQPLPTYRVAGDVALGLGIVLAGITLWQYFTRPSARDDGGAPRDVAAW